MAHDPYVAPTIEGLQVLSKTHEISLILKGVFDIFNGNESIDISGEGVMINVRLDNNKIVVELVGEG